MNAFGRMKISRQLLILTVVATLLVFGSLILLVGKLSRDAALRQAEESLRYELGMLSSFLDYTFQTQVTTAKRRLNAFQKLLPGPLTVGSASMKTGETEGVPVVRSGSEVMNNNLRYLEALKQINTGEGFILARKDGQYIRVATLLKDGRGNSQVGQALKPDEPQVAALNAGKEYVGIIHRNGKSYMSIYEPIRDEAGRVVGAYGLRSSLEADLAALREIIKKQKVGQTGYFFAFSGDAAGVGRLTIHPGKEGSSFRDLFGSQPEVLRLFEEVVRDQGGTKIYPWANPARDGRVEEKMTVFGYSKDWGWYFGAGTFIDELTVDADRLRHILILATVLAALLIGGAIYLGIRNRLQPLTPVLAGLTAIGNGNLALDLPMAPAGSDNELDRLNNELKTTASEIRGLVGAISVSSEQLAAAATQLDRSSGEVAISTQEQSDAAAAMAASIEEFTVSVGQVADLAREASEITRQEHAAAALGEQLVNEVKRDMEVLAAAVQESGTLVDSLGRRSVDIEGIVRLIKEIAEQTNLLALNAAIEAARAGEAGRGFAVVADEVRKLAERTTGATGDISQVIAGVRSETGQVVEQMRVVVSDVGNSVAKVEQAGAALRDIRVHSDRSREVVADIASATQEQSLAGNQVAQKLESVAQMAEETSSVTAQNRQAASELGKLSLHLHEQVGRFRL